MDASNGYQDYKTHTLPWAWFEDPAFAIIAGGRCKDASFFTVLFTQYFTLFFTAMNVKSSVKKAVKKNVNESV